jgi:glycosyltransferase involved in cell wall biosynthesis
MWQAWRLARDTACRRSYEQRWFWATAAAEAVGRSFRDVRPDVVIFAQLFMAAYVDFEAWHVPVVFDSHNSEGDRLRSVARSDGSVLRRVIHRLQIAPTEEYERKVVAASSLVLAVSEAEAKVFRSVAPGRVLVVPNGVDLPAEIPVASREGILFVGSFGYGANRDALQHLLTDILPHVREGATVKIVGSGRMPEVREGQAGDRIEFIGAVEDVSPYFSHARVVVAPLRHGAGTKIKILEAMAHGTPVVTTSIGAAGLEVKRDTHLLVADDPREFAVQVDRVLRDPALFARLSGAGRDLVATRYTWAAIGDSFHLALSKHAVPVTPR